jgi:hypothetical protein
MVMVAALEKKNWLDILVSLVGAFVIMAFGSRGPILCMLSLLVMYMLINKKVHKHIWFFATVIVLLAITTLMYEEMLLQIRWLVERIGMSTRVFDLVLSGEFAESLGREQIQRVLTEAIMNNWFGYGIAGDRAIVGTYSHSLMWELWTSFGVFAGSFLLVILVFYFVKLLLQKAKSPSEGDGLLIVLFASCFVKLFMSGSYLIEPVFFLMIGIVIAEYRKAYTAEMTDGKA